MSKLQILILLVCLALVAVLLGKRRLVNFRLMLSGYLCAVIGHKCRAVHRTNTGLTSRCSRCYEKFAKSDHDARWELRN